MTKKIVLTILIIVALLAVIYKWIMSNDEEQQKVEETETANEKETVNGNKAEEAITEDKVNENHNK